jgi:hypothetical protein
MPGAAQGRPQTISDAVATAARGDERVLVVATLLVRLRNFGYPAYRVEFGSAAQVASVGLEKGFLSYYIS